MVLSDQKVFFLTKNIFQTNFLFVQNYLTSQGFYEKNKQIGWLNKVFVEIDWVTNFFEF